ncbi:MAG: asparagine synthase (glutamine-hydrolyzing) [Chitinophagales bacterium]|nr:asparagine synthase (glutamine-hydrolyzing) [Chitinophagales bacterium]
MCGIVGHISKNKSIVLSELEQANALLKHRGPDAAHVLQINEEIAFGHTRLSFLDLSNLGEQPMYSTSQKTCISFNGEINNYLELKEELQESYSFQSASDTEVILAAYEQWGIAMLDKLEGMFAFALYDLVLNKVFLVRDRFGIKPLYYYKTKEEVIFASELKAIHAFSSFYKELNYEAFCDFFVYRYIPSPKTIWLNTYKVKPAHYLEINVESLEFTEQEYWKLYGQNEDVDQETLRTYVDKTFSNSIAHNARADVPVGAFLSGGYDSSAICAYMKELAYAPKSFSIGFENWENSEDQFAKLVAKHLDISNQSVIANKDSLDLIELMPQVYDEPIADISIIPTYMVSRLARKEVKAVMGGEGADELFVGYTWQKDYYNLQHPQKLLDKIKNLFKQQDIVLYYAQAMSMGMFDKQELKAMLSENLHPHIPEDPFWFYKEHVREDLEGLKKIQHLDIKCFMAELVLTKVDRASMANSLEVRVPFLDHHLFEKIFSVKESAYFDVESTKALLYKNIKNKLPKEILARKKQGFVGPDSYYMDKTWYRNQLKNSSLVAHGLIKKSYIDALLEKDYDWRIWKILVMDKWYKEWLT